MKTARFFYPLFLTLFCAATLAAQQQTASTPKPSVFEALTTTEGVALTLETDMVTCKNNRKTDQYFPGVLTSVDGRSYKVDVKTRGKFRRKMSEIPPLKIKFSKKELNRFGLDTMNEIKLVLPFSFDKKSEDLLIREYIAYRMWESLSPYSVRARLVQLTMKDVHLGTQQLIYCILLEDKEETLARMNGVLDETYDMDLDQFDGEQLALTSLFEYMIGNTDWDLKGFRNVRLVRIAGREQVIPIPYDFDFSGLVNAPYATPSFESGKANVRQRFFMVNGLGQADFTAAVTKVQAARADLLALCDSPLLSKKSVTYLHKYLNNFYDNMPTCSDVQCMTEKVTETVWNGSKK